MKKCFSVWNFLIWNNTAKRNSLPLFLVYFKLKIYPYYVYHICITSVVVQIGIIYSLTCICCKGDVNKKAPISEVPIWWSKKALHVYKQNIYTVNLNSFTNCGIYVFLFYIYVVLNYILLLL